MSLLIPLGLLGLLSIIGLILIYIIKPNYQQRRVSSTYVWKLSLKYKKKRIPVSRLSQILIFICQLIILTLCALLLAKPSILEERVDYKTESVVIIDASASMMVTENGESRFDRAVAQVKDFADGVMDNDGVLSVIVADYNAYFLVQRSSADDAVTVSDSIAELQAEGTAKCTYGSADMEGAVALAEQVLDINSQAKVYLYTATNYINKNGINVISVAQEDEWNAAILDCSAKLDERNYYSVSIDVGCYGRSAQLAVYCDIYGVNDDENSIVRLSKTAFFDSFEDEMTITFSPDECGSIYSFKSMHVYLQETDSFEYDNNYYYYGGEREKIKIQYASSNPGNFFKTICRTWRRKFKNQWNIEYTFLDADQTPAIEGYDIYIFENAMPETLPTDGLVILMNPNMSPVNSGLRFGETINISDDSPLGIKAGNEHEITKFVDASKITISSYKRLISADGYEELMHYGNDPVMLVKNERNLKVLACAFSVNFSNISILKEFPLLMYNTFKYFIPSTVTDYAFEIGDTLTLNARGEDLNVSCPNGDEEYIVELPSEFRVDNPGIYTFTQTAMNGGYIVENVFVKVPNFESNITKEVESLPLLHVNSKQEYADKDLLMYFAAALVAFMFVEWLLQSREYFR